MRIPNNPILSKPMKTLQKKFKKHVISVVFAIVGLSGTLTAQQNEWEILNPRPTRQNLNVVEFVNPETGFVANDYGTYYTTDGGENWTTREDLYGSRDIAFFGNHGYLLNDYGLNNTIYESINGGVTWAPLSLELEGNSIRVQFVNENHIVITSTEQLIISDNGGENWYTIELTVNGIVDSYFHANFSGVVVTSSGYIYSTLDNGLNWTERFDQNGSWDAFFKVEFISPLIGFATSEGWDTSLLKTIDGGITWEPIEEITHEMYDIEFIDETTGFIAGEFGKVFKTVDAGESWEEITNEDFGFSNNYDINAFYAHDANTLTTVGQKGRISNTSDSGDNWTQNTNIFATIRDIFVLNDEFAYLLTANMVYESTDGGESWEEFSEVPNAGYGNAMNILFVTDVVGYLTKSGSTFGHYFATYNGGWSWVQLESPTTSMNSVQYTGYYYPDTLITSTSYSSGNLSSANATYKLTNLGTQWTQIYDNTIKSICLVNGQLMYGIEYDSNERKILKSTNGGESWQSVFQTVDSSLYALDFPSENVGYCLTGQNYYYKTIDGGLSWNFIEFPENVNDGFFRKLYFVDEMQGYILDEEDGIIYQTQDGGETWTNSISAYGTKVLKAYGDYLYAAGDDGYLARLELPYPLSTEQDIDKSYSWKVFPNPSDNVITITVPKNTSDGAFKIYDAMGKLIKEIQPQYSQASIQVDLNGLPAGMYFVSFISDGKVETQKLVLN